MPAITVVILPEPERTRIRVTAFESKILEGSLPTLPMSEPRALPTLLEGLALAFEQKLSVVLVAADSADSYCSATYAALVETRPLFWDVGVAALAVEEPPHPGEAPPDDLDFLVGGSGKR